MPAVQHLWHDTCGITLFIPVVAVARRDAAPMAWLHVQTQCMARHAWLACARGCALMACTLGVARNDMKAWHGMTCA